MWLIMVELTRRISKSLFKNVVAWETLVGKPILLHQPVTYYGGNISAVIYYAKEAQFNLFDAYVLAPSKKRR